MKLPAVAPGKVCKVCNSCRPTLLWLVARVHAAEGQQTAHPTSVRQAYNQVLSPVSFQLSEEEEPSQLTADLSSTHMQDFEDKGQEGTQQQRGLEDKKPYHFNKRESQIMRIAVDTMHMAGMALVCQGFAIFLMGAHAQPAVCRPCANEPASGRPGPT